MSNLTEVSILSHQEIATGVYLIKFKRNFDFIPGQIIGITNSQKISPRLYSICSSNKSNTIGILYQVKTGGLLTPALEKNNPGDNLWITPVQGNFVFNDEPAWWIATGTGIAPFYSMFSSGKKPLKLIHGARKLEHFYFKDELINFPGYVPCCSTEQGEGIYNARLTLYIRNFENLPTHINYYLCGSAEMVVDVRNLLISKGVSYNNIITEIYF